MDGNSLSIEIHGAHRLVFVFKNDYFPVENTETTVIPSKKIADNLINKPSKACDTCLKN